MHTCSFEGVIMVPLYGECTGDFRMYKDEAFYFLFEVRTTILLRDLDFVRNWDSDVFIVVRTSNKKI